MAKNILLIENDAAATTLTDTLERHGYHVSLVTDQQKGLEWATAQNYHLIILNTRLAGFDGIHFCRQLRSQGCQQPILLLVEDASTEGIAGLNAGADDYVLQPFHSPELLARVQALLRRPEISSDSALLQWGELCLNSTSAEVTYRGEPLSLTPKEFSLLELFLLHPQRVFSRTAILDLLWALDALPHESTVTNHIKELRQKLKAAGIPVDIIETVYGLGYRLKPPSKVKATALPPSSAAGLHTATPATDTPRVLVIDDDPTLLSALSYLLQPWGLHVTGLSHPDHIWKTLNTVIPDLLILDLELDNCSGVDLCRSVRQDTRWGDLPILVMTAYTDAEAIQWAFAAGADDFVGKPIVGPELVTRVVSRLEQQRTLAARGSLNPQPVLQPSSTGLKMHHSIRETYGNILLVDDQPDNLRTLSKILSRQGYKVRKALSGATALKAIRSQPPDLVVLDVRMPEMNGYEVCAALKAQAETREIPILFLSALDDTADKLQAFAVGGADYITKPFQEEEVLARIKQQFILLQQQQQLAERNHQLQREIWAKQQSEARLQQVQETLQESEARFQYVFSQSATALALVELDDRWRRVNPALCRLLGYTEAELLDRPISSCLSYPEPDRTPFSIASFISLVIDQQQVELCGHCQSGQTVRLWATVSIVQTAQQTPLYAVIQLQANLPPDI